MTTNTPPVTAVCSSAVTTTMTAVMVPTSTVLAAALGHDVVLLPPQILKDTVRGIVGLTTVLQQ